MDCVANQENDRFSVSQLEGQKKINMNFIENILYSFLELIPRAFNIRLRYVWVVQKNHGTPFEVAFHPKDSMDTLNGLITQTLSQHGRPSIAVDKIYSPADDGNMHCDVVIEGFELITNHIEENSYSRPFWFTISERLSSSEMRAWVQQEGYAPFQVLIRSSDLIDDLKESIAVTLYRRGRTGHSEVRNVYMSDANGHMNLNIQCQILKN